MTMVTRALAIGVALILADPTIGFAQQTQQQQQQQQQPPRPQQRQQRPPQAQPQQPETPSPTPVAKLAPAVMATIDLNAVVRQSIASQKVQEQIEAQRAVFQSEISKLEAQLRQQEMELAQQRATLAPDVFTSRTREFQDRAANVQQQVNIRKRRLEQAFEDAMQEIRGALGDIIIDLAKESGATVVMPRAAIVYSDPKLDLSREALVRLDRKLPSVTVKVPAAPR